MGFGRKKKKKPQPQPQPQRPPAEPLSRTEWGPRLNRIIYFSNGKKIPIDDRKYQAQALMGEFENNPEEANRQMILASQTARADEDAKRRKGFAERYMAGPKDEKAKEALAKGTPDTGDKRYIQNLGSSEIINDADVTKLGKEREAGGMMSDVRQVTYRKGPSKQDRQGFFKADAPTIIPQQLGLARVHTAAGVGVHKQPGKDGPRDRLQDQAVRNSARSVASSRLDQALGTNVLAKEEFAQIGGRTGAVSSKAAGVTFGELLKKQGAGAEETMSNPEMLRQLSDLQALDWISGQNDRHGNNMYWDEESQKLTGIDNDNSHGISKDVRSGDSRSFAGMPTHLDASTSKAIAGMKEADLRKLLAGKKSDLTRLNKDEIDEAVARLDMLQKAIKGEGDHKVDEVSDWRGRYGDMVDRGERRDFMDSAWNYPQMLARGEISSARADRKKKEESEAWQGRLPPSTPILDLAKKASRKKKT